MNDCVFCRKISAGGDEHGPVYDEGCGIVRFEPLNPVTTGHMLFVPMRHACRADDQPQLLATAAGVAARYMRSQGVAQDYNLIQSNGSNATQTVPHLHVHLVPRRAGDGLMLPWSDHKDEEH